MEGLNLMPAAISRFPDSTHLLDGLTSALAGSGAETGPIAVLKREPNPNTSTFPAEILTLQFADGRVSKVLCKYEGNIEEDCDGHRRGMDYEVAVYSDILRPIGCSTPGFYGGHRDPVTGQFWLLIEYLEKSYRVHRTHAPRATMLLASQWIGRFHAAAERAAFHRSSPFLVNYDSEYYRRWPLRTFEVTRHLHARWPWLAKVCEGAVELLPRLGNGTGTIIHGEFFPKNILFRDQRICPVDWQSAALAAGEIDLASLISGHWGEECVQELTLAYTQSRWPAGPPRDFEYRLRLAQLYWPMRFLADMEPMLPAEEVRGWTDELRAPAEGLGLI